ncbi:MAG: NAD-glutamate dehydrogenase, partial [Solirubrobacterales bacterium]|nr:NAD-glutamate dehydrogenase [Solirubrobacterales bacterium]
MALKTVAHESELIDTVCARVRERLPNERASACETFVRQYYQWVPAEDLAGRSPLDLYGAAVAHWNLAQRRAPGEAKVRVYNPDLEQHGWQSPHTVVEVVSDDMPFVVDSINIELARNGYGIDLVIHPVIQVRRDDHEKLVDVLETGQEEPDAVAESIVHAEVVREPDRHRLDELRANIERVLCEVRVAVEDWQPMRERTRALIEELRCDAPPIAPQEIDEVRAFLAWVEEDNFTYLGYREYELVSEDDGMGLRAIADSGLGILRGTPRTAYTKLRPKALALARSPYPLVLTKANSRATVHRPAYLDYIGVKRFSPEGEVIGERRFLGLYTTTAYRSSARDIPLLRGKVEGVLERAGFAPESHDAKALIEILETLPRDSLFQVDTENLFETSIGILGLGERQRVRLFLWPDPLDRFISCLVTIPRDRFNTENRERVGRILVETFGGTHLDWGLHLGESLLARVHYIVRCPDGIVPGYNVAEIEARLAAATRAWTDDLRAALIDEHGEDRGSKLYKRYGQAFPAAYRADWVARHAVADIGHLEQLSDSGEPILSLYRPLEASDGLIRCKLFSSGGISLSDVLPSFEHMGADVVDERPYEITPDAGESVWIYDFGLRSAAGDLERVRDMFQEAFLAVWRGELEDDRLNGLVLRAALTGREITIVRAIAKYLRQAGSAFSDRYMERTLVGNHEITTKLVKL